MPFKKIQRSKLKPKRKSSQEKIHNKSVFVNASSRILNTRSASVDLLLKETKITNPLNISSLIQLPKSDQSKILAIT